MIKQTAYKFQIYPTDEQIKQIQKFFDSCRFVYNYYLEKTSDLYKKEKKSLFYYDYAKDLTKLKKKNKCLQDVSSTMLQSTLRDLDKAYRFFFRNKEHFKYPTPKKNVTSFTCRGTIKYSNNQIWIPRIGWVKSKGNKTPEGKINYLTISKSSTGKYYASICCEKDFIEKDKTGKAIGIDLGLKNYCTTSDGNKYDNPQYFQQSLKRINKTHHQLSKKNKDSENYKKNKIKLAKAYTHITNQRKDYLHKLSTKIISENDIICIESLCINDMLENHIRSRNIQDAAWKEFIDMLKYKADRYGKIVVEVDRYFPSSQICHCCGYKNPELKDLNIREWICPQCGFKHDRDINAAKNILAEGLKILSS